MISYLPKDKFETIKQLGRGAFGIVTLARNRFLGRYEAIKEIELNDPQLSENAMEEAKKLEELKHRAIVKIYDADYLDQRKGIYISMEYLPRGGVDRLRFVTTLKLKRICLDILSALDYAHSRNYIHRDIKPNNILLAEDGTAKLSDFGIATKQNILGTAGPAGYVKHLAPEIFQGKECSVSSDIYAMGVTMHRIINGDLPHLSRMSAAEWEKVIVNGEYPSRHEYRPDVLPKLMKLINRALDVDPQQRFNNAKEMADELRKIKIKCEWVQKKKGTNGEWEGKTDDKVINVFYSETSGEIVTKQKRHRGQSFRRITGLCFHGLSRSELNRKLRTILTGFESGRF